MLRSWEAEFPGLGKPAAGGRRPRLSAGGRRAGAAHQAAGVRRRADARRRAAAARGRRSRSWRVGRRGRPSTICSAMAARTRLREVRSGLGSDSADARTCRRRAPAELTLVAPDSRTKVAAGQAAQSELMQTSSVERCRDVAQPGSALDWGSRGRGFESRHPDHIFESVLFTSSTYE